MGVRARILGRTVVGMIGGLWLLGCGDSAGPQRVSSEWPYLTTVESTNVAVTGTNELLIETSRPNSRTEPVCAAVTALPTANADRMEESPRWER